MGQQEEPASRLRFLGGTKGCPETVPLLVARAPARLSPVSVFFIFGAAGQFRGAGPRPEGVCMSGLVGELLWGVGVSASRLCWSPSKCVGSPTSPPAVGGVGSRVGQGTESWAILVKSFHSPINGRTNVPSTADQSSSPLWRWNQSSIARRPAQ